MSPERLLQYFECISEAPDAVPRLRRFILDLAVRGKLVEQNPEDEPAEELLEAIRAEQRRLSKEGCLPRRKPPAALSSAELPFNVPRGWTWVRLYDVVGYLQRGKSPKYASGDGHPVVSQKCVQWDGLHLEWAKKIEPKSLDRYESFRFLRDGDLLWNSTGTGTIGRVLRVTDPPDKLVCDSHVTVVRCLKTKSEFVRIWLISDYVYGDIEGRAAGSTNQVELTAAMANNQVIPLPPLAEQHRIVAKVHELMALCDELEAAQAKREDRRARLVAATLHGLNNGDTEPGTNTGLDFTQSARFYLNHLPRLTTRPEHVHQLRQTILNLAVRGKLVEQDPEEGTGIELLEKVRALKATLMREKSIRRDKDIELSHPDTTNFAPSSWTWAYVGDVALVQGGKRLPRGVSFSKSPTPHIYIRVTDMKNGTIMRNDLHYITPEIQRLISRYTINKEDLYITIAGTIGEVGSVPAFFDGHNLTENAAKLVFRGLHADYFQLVLSSGFVQAQFHEKTKQMAQPKLALKRIAGALFPLPPLAEQYRIVAKVDELMALCDELEAHLTTAATTRARLLDATLHEALNGTGDTAEAAMAD